MEKEMEKEKNIGMENKMKKKKGMEKEMNIIMMVN